MAKIHGKTIFGQRLVIQAFVGPDGLQKIGRSLLLNYLMPQETPKF